MMMVLAENPGFARFLFQVGTLQSSHAQLLDFHAM